jgi:GTP-binding protein EngB required for normal cell division
MGFAFNRPFGLMTPDRGEGIPGRDLGFEGDYEKTMPAGISRRALSYSGSCNANEGVSGTMAENVMLREERPERLLERLVEIGDRFRLQSLAPQIQACRQGLREDGAIDVAVLGRFKAGKSSFLNCLADRDVLPVGAVPVTSVITVLAFGEREQARVRFQDGGERIVPVSELPNFVTEEENPENRKSVSIVTVDLPSLRMYPNTRFLDTPGLGSAFRHNTQVTMEWLPRAAAALVAITADQPVSEQDIDLLSDLARHTPRIVILLTKVDLLSESDLAAVTRHVRATLGKELGAAFPLFPFSCRSGVDRWRGEIAERLLSPLASRRKEETKAILSHKMRTLIREQRQYLRIASKAASAHDSLRESLRGRILNERVQLENVLEEVSLVAGKCREDVRVRIEERILRHQGTLLRKTRELLAGEMASWRGNLWRLTRRYERWAQDHFTRELADLSASEAEGFQEMLQDVRGRMERLVEGFQGRLADNVRTVLGIEFERSRVSLDVRVPRMPDTSCGRVFDSHFDIVWFLIPTTLFGPLIRRHFLHHVGFETEKNLFRLSATWRESTRSEIDRLAGQAKKTIRSELSTLEDLLGRQAAESPGISEVISELTGYLEVPR